MRQVLREKWSESVLLLCVFHILQQIWRWLYDKTHGIDSDHRVELMGTIKSVLYVKTVEELTNRIPKMLADKKVKKYFNLVAYLKELVERKKEWAICYRSNLMIRGNDTNNHCEAQFLVLKVVTFLTWYFFMVINKVESTEIVWNQCVNLP